MGPFVPRLRERGATTIAIYCNLSIPTRLHARSLEGADSRSYVFIRELHDPSKVRRCHVGHAYQIVPPGLDVGVHLRQEDIWIVVSKELRRYLS